MALTTNARGSIQYSITGAPDLGSARASRDHVDSANWTNGTGANQADVVFSDTRNVAASTVDSLDLSGSLEDVLGNSAVFAKVKAIEIRAASTNGSTITVGGAASNAFVGPFAESLLQSATLARGSPRSSRVYDCVMSFSQSSRPISA